ncbi:MAG TPA: hypothetical protein VEB63_09120 [Chitinophagaceae bacterium]|nr:hypothetical protein [Chitinophagaceae bacterium]
MKLFRLYAILLVGFGGVLTSCEKTFDSKFATQSDLSNSSVVQVYMAMVNASRNYVYVNAKPVTGALMSSGSVFPTTGYGFNVPGGLHAFLVRDTSSTTTQATLSFSENLQASKNYTIFIYDTITSPKQKTVNTNIVVPSDTTARLRFANFVYNPSALPTGFDIFSVKRNAVIFSNVRETEVTEFIPFAAAVTDTFYIRPTGSGTNLQNRTVSGTPPVTSYSNIQAILTPTRKRSYTLVFRGSWRNDLNGSSTVRALSIFANY